MFKIYDGRNQFYQWDIDRKLIVEDAEITEVHFCNRTDDCSLVCETYVEDGLTVVNVPNVLLQEDWRINVYAYNRNYTKFTKQFDVVKRSKPADYVYTETEIKNYDDLVARVDQIEQNGVSEETVAKAVEKYLDENDIQVDLTGYATEKYVDDAVAAIELTPGPAGKDGKDGAPGKDGKDGEDYVLTDADKREIAGMVEVTGGGDADLTNYYTKAEVDAAINEIELTPGPQGPAGQDYILTEADKQDIASMVEVTGGGDVDLSNYYTKEEVHAAIPVVAGTGSNSVKSPGAGVAEGTDSVALGKSARATGEQAIAIGCGCTPSGMGSLAMGRSADASGQYSVSIGYMSNAAQPKQVAIGRYNADDANATFILGNGVKSSERANAMVVYETDNQVHFPGKVTMGESQDELATKVYVNSVAMGGIDTSIFYTKTEIDNMFNDIAMAEEGEY